ncbi:MAG: hypothetical protein V9E83_02415 [Baekduia sp.]
MSKRRKKTPRPRPPAARPAAERTERPASNERDLPSVKSRPEEAPQPPWAPLPLTELVILLGIVVAAIGWLAASGDRRTAMLIGGIGLVSLASAELAWREHVAGYRSHTLLLAGVPAALAAALSWWLWERFALYPRQAVPVLPLIVFVLCAWQLRELFKRRSGGIGFRV